MKSIQQNLKKVQDALYGVTENAFHYRRPKSAPKSSYIVWTEDGEDGSFNAGNSKREQQIHGTIDYYTLMEFDPLADGIQEALSGLDGAGWRLNSIQYEDETNLIHYEWEFWVA